MERGVSEQGNGAGYHSDTYFKMINRLLTALHLGLPAPHMGTPQADFGT